jgi:surface carbohydrate biosynthesis protein
MNFFNMRKPTILTKKHCDILIFDSIGINWTHKCIPPGYLTCYIDIRRSLPIILDQKFFRRLIVAFFRPVAITRGRLGFAYVTALFEQIDPKIILTFADNNPLILEYARIYPTKCIICVQNALRDTIGSVPKDSTLPIYFSFGSIESLIFRDCKITCRTYIPIGSVKLGIALEEFSLNSKNKFDICFISHYRPEMYSQNAQALYKKIDHAQRTLFSHIKRYADDRGLSVAVCSKTRDPVLQISERKYFDNIFGNQKFSFIKADKNTNEFNTYYSALASDLIIHPASTLGFELYSAKKKVLFGANNSDNLLTDWGIDHYFSHLPDAIKLNSYSYEEFSQKASELRKMRHPQYIEHTRHSAHLVISMPTKRYPHEILRDTIRYYLNN